MLARRIAVVLGLTSALAVAFAPPVGARAVTDVFDTSVVHEIKLFMNSRELPQLRANFLGNNYYPADFEWNGTRVRNVGVRSRGSGSRLQSKLGLRLDFNRYTTNQTFQGLKALDFDNLTQDPSTMREFLAMQIFRR